MKILISILSYLLVFNVTTLFSQENELVRIDKLRTELMNVAEVAPGLNQPVEISLSNASIQEFIRGIALANGLNMNVDNGLDIRITNNFKNAPVKDILIFLCKEYGLTLDITGSIISINEYKPPIEVIPEKAPVPLDINYKRNSDLLSINVKEDTLFEVAKRITDVSLRNVVIGPDIRNKEVSAFIKNRPFENALENFAFANGISLRVEEGNFFILENKSEDQKDRTAEYGINTNQITPYTKPNIKGLQLTTRDNLLTIRASDVSISDLIAAVTYELGTPFYLFDKPVSKTTLYVEDATLEEFLTFLFSGSDFTFKESENVYLIGKRNQERLRSSELITLENRTVESIEKSIPKELTEGVEIGEFPDLNGLIISGSYTRIEEIKTFLRTIDKPVPVVLIDLMIVEVNKDYNIETGIQMTLGGESVPNNTSGTYNGNSSGFQTTMTSKTLNALLNSLVGPGLINMGSLSPDFYASIKALENNGIIKKKSTPKLATMNGSLASLRLGETTFYAETNNSFIGTQNPSLSQGTVFKPINADLSISIQPFVSGDEQITLTIDFTQSNFTNRISPQAPPGSQTKSFSSKIRVKNGETILLGGLDEKSTERSAEGLPILSRIPVVKWFVSSNKRSNSTSQVNIFIKPTVIF